MNKEIKLSGFHQSAVESTITDVQKADYNRQRPKKDAETLCYAPYANLYFGRQGTVHCCCNNRDYVVGEYPKDSIDEIWNGSRINKLREYLVNYNLSLNCDYCQDDFNRCGYSQVPAQHFDRLELNNDRPSMMEFELDTICNLECQMCTGELSTAIRKNRDHLPPIKSHYDGAFVEQIKPYLPHLKETRFSGGEPFLIPIYYQIWEELTKVNPECLISVQTNGTVLNNKVKAQMEKGRFEIGVSLDSLVKETFEDIRKNAKFETVMENVAYFSEYCKRKGTGFRLSICVMRNNWKDLPEYINMCNRLNAYACFHKVFNPKELSLIYWDSE
ncbi:MAG: SPASM domain-containing protein, partial [Flavobacteriales bacterium]|nr:SPASM domain-containing protein [Flavobacteriales bacterium]